jgi:hypothetical protein
MRLIINSYVYYQSCLHYYILFFTEQHFFKVGNKILPPDIENADIAYKTRSYQKKVIYRNTQPI